MKGEVEEVMRGRHPAAGSRPYRTVPSFASFVLVAAAGRLLFVAAAGRRCIPFFHSLHALRPCFPTKLH